MADLKKSAPPKKKLAPPVPEEKFDINKADDWIGLRTAWAKEKFEEWQARADKFFTTDEDMPLSQHILLSSIVAFIVVFILWANFATLDEVTKGEGKVVPSSEVQILQSLEGGIIDEFLVREGDHVVVDQPVIRLRNIQASSDLGSNTNRYLGLQAKIQRLKAESEGLPTPKFSDEVMKGAPQAVQEELQAFRANQKNMSSQTDILQQQLSQRQQEINELTTRISDLRQVISLSQQERNMTAPLVERGSAPKMELIQLDRALKEKQTELNSLTTSLPRTQAAVREAKARIGEIKNAAAAQAQTELAAASAESNALRETLGALQDRKTRTELKSTVNGTVKDIKITTVGGVVQPGADLVEIVPRDDQLIVEAKIRPADIAFLHPNQKVVVKITAYDYSVYGALTGELVDISADTISNEKGEMFYRVRVRTPETHLKHRGRKLEIIPGMVATVDILTGKKTVMEYIMKPFVKTLSNSLTER